MKIIDRKEKRRVVLYMLILSVVIGASYSYLAQIPYLKDYVDGFLSRNNQADTKKHLLSVNENGQSDEVVILDIAKWPGDEHRSFLSELIDSIMSYKPAVLGIDLKLLPKDKEMDSILFNTIRAYDNIVLAFDIFDSIFPLGMEYDDFPNVCYSNFEVIESMPRYLIPYYGQYTSFWARLWEIYANIPSGELKSKRRFINYNLKPVVHDVKNYFDLSLVSDYIDNIVIIGDTNRDDVFNVPKDDNSKSQLHERHLMSGIDIIGSATLTIGDNELDNNFFDKNRWFAGLICWVILVAIFTAIHFCNSKWVLFIRRIGNFFQLACGIILFIAAKEVSTTKDEHWFLFSIVAVFILIAPVVADLENYVHEIKDNRHLRKK